GGLPLRRRREGSLSGVRGDHLQDWLLRRGQGRRWRRLFVVAVPSAKLPPATHHSLLSRRMGAPASGGRFFCHGLSRRHGLSGTLIICPRRGTCGRECL